MGACSTKTKDGEGRTYAFKKDINAAHSRTSERSASSGSSSSKSRNFVTDPSEILTREHLSAGCAFDPPATTIPEAFRRRVATFGDRVALRVRRSKEDPEWSEWTMSQYRTEVLSVARALVAVGFQVHDAVSILAFNSPEWFFAALGAIHAGGLAAGIYTTNGTAACRYIVEHSKSKVVFTDPEYLPKITEACASLPFLKYIVLMRGKKPAHSASTVLEWDEFLALGTDEGDAVVAGRVEGMVPGNACYLSYTSGTTGNPKAVMYSHDNILYGFGAVYRTVYSDCPMGTDAREVCYLPMSHVAGSLQLFAPLVLDDASFTVTHFAFPDALQGSLKDTLVEVRPTTFAAVPRVWEKLEAGLRPAIAAKAPAALEAITKRQSVGEAGKAFLHAVGLDQVVTALVGAAPVSEDTLHFFKSLGITIREIYGMTENAAVSHYNYGPEPELGTVGRPIVPGSIKLSANSEILVQHRAVMMGYMYNERETREALKRGWLHTGDLGSIVTGTEHDGVYMIVGRIKELVITAGGENIPPVLIEADLKERLPAVSNAVVIGDRQKFLVALFTLKTAPQASGPMAGLPGDELSGEAAAVDEECTTVADALKSDKWNAYMESGVAAYNTTGAMSRAQNIRKWAILPNEFLPVGPTPELTPTLKLKRNVVHEKYAGVIRGLYGDDFVNVPWCTQAP